MWNASEHEANAVHTLVGIEVIRLVACLLPHPWSRFRWWWWCSGWQTSRSHKQAGVSAHRHQTRVCFVISWLGSSLLISCTRYAASVDGDRASRLTHSLARVLVCLIGREVPRVQGPQARCRGASVGDTSRTRSFAAIAQDACRSRHAYVSLTHTVRQCLASPLTPALLAQWTK